jgi:Zn-dependent protease with chaperone function
MNFFEQQHRARRRSALLVLLFILAVLGIVVATNLMVLGAFYLYGTIQLDGLIPFSTWLKQHPRIVLWTSVITIGFIGAASLYRIASLSQGGGAVARLLGGVRVDSASHDSRHRQLLNVVEETAIAAGLPVPEVYVLDREAGINAFAAGFSPSDAAIAVTRGMLESLTRDELQGVIAHEFSHILNGDTRLNMRLLGVGFGILVIALTGRMTLRAVAESRGSGSDGRAIMAGYFFGLLLVVIGYIGVLAANLIKAAVSRDRERLADAAAVQFTRNPHGLAGALKKIAVSPLRATITSAEGEEVSHMLIAEPGGLFTRMFASHPPLLERIRWLEPRFDPSDLKQVQLAPMRPSLPPQIEAPLPALAEIAGLAPHRVLAMVGNPGQAALLTAAALEQGLTPTLRDAAHSSHDALYLVLAMLLHADRPIREAQLEKIRERLPQAPLGYIENLAVQLSRLDRAQRLPLFELAFPALRRRPPLELRQLIGMVDDLVRADGITTIFDYTLSRLLRQQLNETLSPQSVPSRTVPKLYTLRHEAQTLFSLLAQSGHAQTNEARTAYEAGMRHLLADVPPYTPPDPWVELLDQALLKLDKLPPMVKQELITGLTITVLYDRQIMLAEAELLRVICALLHCPLPPLVAAKDDGSPGNAFGVSGSTAI